MFYHFFQWLTQHYRGSHILSLYLRKKVESAHVRQLLGVHLAGFAFITAVIVPQVDAITSQVEVLQETQETVIEVIPTQSRFQWPISRFGLTTRFSLGHPGLDLTSPKGTAIKPVSEGKVLWIKRLSWGYGNHVLVEHDGDAKSLYAHLSKVEVKEGQTIDKDTIVGEVGSTGWSTGNHLHLEIYQDGIPVNPLEVLPTVSLESK
ncbi:hypothetical protein A2973_00350 [Candidatus Gottesmanbacteria bacterium RIFCSPLOWO2_01_FULL_49_10]|uniref:M23ase beta-sheet core domain-containing protein n=1 Tax=Candidatus Gottesmanbacteria bacterium RIFCSPLOWO2_01_FULL_49_10 TaxID=1798396 RepID=A0A1F6AYV8_9BACT|nr:MAG: hypothetical protein A2973_00350 [Candidatus Gottesmanbacteria bacterium RIFCSPLOWO2_01_FULL_49_10]